MFKFRGYADSA